MDSDTERTLRHIHNEAVERDYKIDKASLNRDEQLTSLISNVLKQQSLTGQISTLQQQKEILGHSYDKASAYANLIILGGYAGLFGIWQLTRGILNDYQNLLIATLLTISIILFAGYEVYKMIDQSFFLNRLAKLIESDLPEKDSIEAWRLGYLEYQLRANRIWLWFLVPTVLTGFGAGVILLWIFARSF